MDFRIGGAHGIFKGSRPEQLFATGRSHRFSRCSRICLYNIGLYELDLDPADLLPPMQREP